MSFFIRQIRLKNECLKIRLKDECPKVDPKNDPFNVGFRFITALLLCLVATLSLPLNAYDQQVSSTLFAEGYSVYRRNGERISRRRFVEDLSLGAWNILPGESEIYYDGPRLSINLSLRIIGDAGVTGAESNPRYKNSYVPGVEPVRFQATTAYIDGKGFWDGTLDIRAGRQIRLDTIGFFAFDGIDTRLHLPISIDLSTYVGLEVRSGKHLGYDSFELDGTDRGSRSGLELEQYTDRENPENRLAMGMELLFFPWRWLDIGVAFRAVGINNGADNLADERVAGQIQVEHGAFHGSGRMMYSPMVNLISEGDVEMGVTIAEKASIIAEFHRFAPLFEGDSIFNVFDLEAQNDLGGRVTIDVTQYLDIAVWGFSRLANDSQGISGKDETSLVSGAGGGVGGNYRNDGWQLSSRLSYVTESGERRMGMELGGGHGFFGGQRLWLFARASYYRIEDDFSALFNGNVFGYILSARFHIAKGFRTLAEFEHYMGDNRPSRFSALALLEFDIWR